MHWYERKYAGLVLRLIGLLLLMLATLIGRHLFGVADLAAKTRPSAYALALIGMASACSGAALAVLGRHLFDQVELSARWTIHAARHDGLAQLRARDPR
jgi:hypothetical protein